MADLQIKIPRNPSWPVDTQLELRLGTEDASSLAASTPAGGVVVLTIPAWGPGGVLKQEEIGLGGGELGEGGLGGPEYPRAVLRYTYLPSKASCRLPIGISAVDEAGNRSGVLEAVLEINDPPQGARRLVAAPGASPGQVGLTWQRSKDA